MTPYEFLKHRLGRLARQAERGATATGYALVVASLITVSIAVIQTLQTNSGEFLENTGSEIGTPRLPSDEAVTSLLPPPPAFAPPTAPLTIITFDDESIRVSALGPNLCLDFVAPSTVSWAQCGVSPNEIQLTGTFSNPNITLSIPGNLCFEADATNNVIAAPCSAASPLQTWIQIDVYDPLTGVQIGDQVQYELQGTGLCMKAVNIPPGVPGDPALELTPCGTASTLEILF